MKDKDQQSTEQLNEDIFNQVLPLEGEHEGRDVIIKQADILGNSPASLADEMGKDRDFIENIEKGEE